MFTDIKPDPKPKREDGKEDRRRHVNPPNDKKNTRRCRLSTSISLETSWRLATSVIEIALIHGPDWTITCSVRVG